MTQTFHALKVSNIIQETHDSRSFIFTIPSELKNTFKYEAGQFLTFEIPWGNIRIQRCYSLASSPHTDSWHKIVVKRVEGGRVSNWFNDNLKAGDRILSRAPQGRFLLRDDHAGRDLNLFAAGSGITPIISLLKTALKTTRRNVLLVYANRDMHSIILKDELDRLEQDYPERCKIVHHLDSNSGFITAEQLSNLINGRESGDCYVCGPTPFMDTVETAFEQAGINKNQRYFERFVSPLDEDRRDVKVNVQMKSEVVPSEFTICLDGEKHTVPYASDKTLLQCAQDAGLKIPFSCKEGYCGCCMARLKSGEVHMPMHDALTEEDINKGWVLPCQAKVASANSVEIDYQK